MNRKDSVINNHGVLQLTPNKVKNIGFLLFSIAGIVAGGVVGTIFFSLVFIFFCIQLLPGSTYLRIQAEGFIVCAFFKQRYEEWKNIKAFYGVSVYGHKMIGYEYTDDYKRIAGKKNNHRVRGPSPALPCTYGLPQDELIELLTAYRNNSFNET